MKILHVVHGLPRGGLETGLVNLANGLPRERFAQEICCLERRGEMADRLAPYVPLQVLDRGRHDLTVPFKLARVVRRARPDVVHCRNWNSWPDTVLGCVLAGFRGELLWSFHGFAEGHSFPLRRRLASRTLAALTGHLLAVCRDSAERYARLAGIRADRFDVIYNGVDTGRFLPRDDAHALRQSLGLPVDRVLVTAVGSLTPVKNHLGLLEAAGRHGAECGDAATFLIVGEGALRAELEGEIERRGLRDRVRLYGASDRVPEILAASDLFVLPSQLEGMSNAILEAMASGLPVVAFRVGGNPELVVHGETGLLCEAGDHGALAAAIGRLVRHREERAAMGEHARRVAVSEFSIDRMIEGYGSYYARIAAGSGALISDA